MRKTRTKWTLEAQREYLDNFALESGYKDKSDWYSVRCADFDEKGSPLHLYGDSVSKMIVAIYPEHEWDIHQFHRPQNFWKDDNNIREYFLRLGKKLEFESMEDWYRIKKSDVTKNGGRGLVHSIPEALSITFPDHHFVPFKFSSVTRDYWRDLKNQRCYTEWLYDHLSLKCLDDWYSVTVKDIVSNYGGSLLNIYNGSPSLMITKLYADHKWEIHRFFRKTHPYDTIEDRKFIVKQIEEKFELKTTDDWYRVSEVDFCSLFSYSILKSFPLSRLLIEIYPNHKWDFDKLRKGAYRSSQNRLGKMVKNLFPESTVLEDYNHPTIKRKNGRPLELDLFLPSEKLAIEYQGEFHFRKLEAKTPSRVQVEKDQEKRMLCKENEIKLLEVPYWEANRESLLTKIKEIVPHFWKDNRNVHEITLNGK